MWSAWVWEIKTEVNWSGLMFESRRFFRLPGPRSKTVESSMTNEGQARFALTAEPPEPRIVSFISSLLSSFLYSFLWFTPSRWRGVNRARHLVAHTISLLADLFVR